LKNIFQILNGIMKIVYAHIAVILILIIKKNIAIMKYGLVKIVVKNSGVKIEIKKVFIYKTEKL